MEILDTTHVHNNVARDTAKVDTIIVHRNELARTGEALANLFKKDVTLGSGRKVPYHLFIRKDGTTEQLVPLGRRAEGAAPCNWCSIQVCLDGDFRTEAPTPEQMASLITLCVGLSVWIGRDRYQLKGHTEAVGVDKKPSQCPGKLLSMDALRATVSAIKYEPLNGLVV